MSIYGRIVTGADVETAVEMTVKKWQADYLAEVADQSSLARGVLPLFRSFPRLLDISKWNEDQTPSCVIAAPGTLQAPTIKQRQVNIRWAVGIGCVVSAKDMQSTLKLAQLYTAAIRSMILQNPSLGGLSDGVVLMSERYDDLASNDARSIASGVVQFGVDVLGITDLSQGAVQPSIDATMSPGDWPEVAAVNIDLEEVQQSG